jgi:hypothetical protein
MVEYQADKNERTEEQINILYEIHKALVRLLADVGDKRTELLTREEDD